MLRSRHLWSELLQFLQHCWKHTHVVKWALLQVPNVEIFLGKLWLNEFYNRSMALFPPFCATAWRNHIMPPPPPDMLNSKSWSKEHPQACRGRMLSTLHQFFHKLQKLRSLFHGQTPTLHCGFLSNCSCVLSALSSFWDLNRPGIIVAAPDELKCRTFPFMATRTFHAPPHRHHTISSENVSGRAKAPNNHSRCRSPLPGCRSNIQLSRSRIHWKPKSIEAAPLKAPPLGRRLINHRATW